MSAPQSNSPTAPEVTRLYELMSWETHHYGFNLRLVLVKCTREEFDTLQRVFQRALSERTTLGPNLSHLA